MSYTTAPRRAPIRRRKDYTPLMLAFMTLCCAGGLGFAVFKFVIKRPPPPVEENTTVATVTLARPKSKPISSPAIEMDPAEFDRKHGFDKFAMNSPSRGPSPGADRFATSEFSGSFTGGTGGGSIYGGSMGGGGDARGAVEKTCGKIKESVDLGKTLIIWLFDKTASCEPRRQEVARLLDTEYAKLAPAAAKDEKPVDAKLLSVVCAFGADVEYVTAEPTADPSEFRTAVAGIKKDEGGIENTFKAIETVVTKYASYAAPPQQRYISVVVVTDEVGNDQQERDRVAELLKKNAIPLYVIGQSAVFGGTGTAAASAEGPNNQVSGPESREVEAISLDFPNGMSIAGNTFQSGIGPYSLTYACRESGGEYFVAGGVGQTIMLPPQYYPKYLSEKNYQESVGKNKAITALIAASKLKHAKQISGPRTSFEVDENGLAVVRDIDMALRPEALIMPQINDLFDTLKKGEPDRNKLTDPRWQAEFDLAMGRVMAAKVRTEGYIVLLAAFKAGRKKMSGQPGTWSLTQADGIEKNSVLESITKKSREYLEGVIKNHPNTPWAAAAQQELSVPIGWKWNDL